MMALEVVTVAVNCHRELVFVDPVLSFAQLFVFYRFRQVFLYLAFSLLQQHLIQVSVVIGKGHLIMLADCQAAVVVRHVRVEMIECLLRASLAIASTACSR